MNDISERVKEISEENVDSCYMCGRCSAGCLFTDEMDMLPHKVMASLQRGKEEVLEQNTPWICASCFVCSTRCPRGVDVAAIMESLRSIKLRKRGFEKVDLQELKKLKEAPQIAITAAAQKLTW